MAKKDKIQYVLNFAADLLSLCVSVLLSWLVTDKVLHVLLDYTQEDWGQFILILAFAFIESLAIYALVISFILRPVRASACSAGFAIVAEQQMKVGREP